jgi:excisionase family DNA binding protein
MKVHAGILLSPATCAAIGPQLLDFLAGWRVAGLQAPRDVRTELEEIAELGRRFQAATLAKGQADVRQSVRLVDSPRAPVVALPAVTYSTGQVAKKLSIGPRAVQRRAERGSLRATRAPGGELRFDSAEVNRIARKEVHG